MLEFWISFWNGDKKGCFSIFPTMKLMLSVGDQATEEEEDDHSAGTTESHSKDMSPDESELDSEAKLMRSMGLPIQFGRVSAHKSFEVLIYFYYFYVLLFKKKKNSVT